MTAKNKILKAFAVAIGLFVALKTMHDEVKFP